MYQSIAAGYRDEMDNLSERIQCFKKADLDYAGLVDKLLELPQRLAKSWHLATEEEKIHLVGLVCSNFLVKDGKVDIELASPFSYLIKMASKKEKLPTWDELRSILQMNHQVIESLSMRLAA